MNPETSAKPGTFPAFPSKAYPGTYQKSYYGITIRDYFASKALNGLLSEPSYCGENWISDVVTDAYKVADAMLKARDSAGDPK
jgi:hypothetical protein